MKLVLVAYIWLSHPHSNNKLDGIFLLYPLDLHACHPQKINMIATVTLLLILILSLKGNSGPVYTNYHYPIE